MRRVLLGVSGTEAWSGGYPSVMNSDSTAAPRTNTPYELLGGDDGIRALVDRFYDLMDSSPEASTVRALHASSLKASRDKLYLYLSYWTGGPQTYVEQRGHPMLRARHLPFTISSRERDEWLWCMDRALDAHEMPGELRAQLRERLHGLADHMRNRPDGAAPTIRAG